MNAVGSSCLILAVSSKASAAVVRALLEHHADVNYQNPSGGSALMIACICQSDLEVVELLYQFYADVALANKTGNTCLHYAVRNGQTLEVVDYLISCGADINAQTSENAKYAKMTPLHFAAGEGRADLAATLVRNHAEMGLQNADGYTALQLCAPEVKTAMMQASFSRFQQAPSTSVVKNAPQPPKRLDPNQPLFRLSGPDSSHRVLSHELNKLIDEAAEAIYYDDCESGDSSYDGLGDGGSRRESSSSEESEPPRRRRSFFSRRRVAG